MALTIRKNIENIRDEVNHPRLKEIQKRALIIVQRIMKDDPEFKEFATLYADPKEGPNRDKHLARLLREDAKGDDYAVTRALAYLFCNSTCGYSTGKTLLEGVDDELDRDLYENTVTGRIKRLEASIAADYGPTE